MLQLLHFWILCFKIKAKNLKKLLSKNKSEVINAGLISKILQILLNTDALLINKLAWFL